jgi:hypothetical protein
MEIHLLSKVRGLSQSGGGLCFGGTRSAPLSTGTDRGMSIRRTDFAIRTKPNPQMRNAAVFARLAQGTNVEFLASSPGLGRRHSGRV